MTDAPPTRADGKLTVALISEVFWEADGTQRLKQRLGEQFLFRNPNVTAECGCGESFTTKADAA